MTPTRIFTVLSVCLISIECLGQVPTAGIYDENLIEPNTVDISAAGSVPFARFAADILAAHAADLGGVAQWGGWSFGYGTSLSKTIHFDPVLAGGGSFGMALSETRAYGSLRAAAGELRFRPTSIDNGLPNEQLVGFGVTVLSANHDYGVTTLTANLSDGSQLVATQQVDGALEQGDTLFALTAPSGRHFTELVLSWENSQAPPRLYFDDIGFITAQVPEPTSCTVWLLAMLACLTRDYISRQKPCPA